MERTLRPNNTGKEDRRVFQRLCDEELEISDEERETSENETEDNTGLSDSNQEYEEDITGENKDMEDKRETFIVTVPTIAEKSLQLQRVVEIDGFIYKRRACSKRGFQYFYCVHSHLKRNAGFRYDPKTHVCIPNSSRHHHPPGPAPRSELKKNLQLVALRMFVEKHRFEESWNIYTLLLDEIAKAPEKYPPQKDISIKAIQNLKGLLAGEDARNLLNPTLPFVLREVDGVNFLAFESVRPVLLMFVVFFHRKGFQTHILHFTEDTYQGTYVEACVLRLFCCI